MLCVSLVLGFGCDVMLRVFSAVGLQRWDWRIVIYWPATTFAWCLRLSFQVFDSRLKMIDVWRSCVELGNLQTLWENNRGRNLMSFKGRCRSWIKWTIIMFFFLCSQNLVSCPSVPSEKHVGILVDIRTWFLMTCASVAFCQLNNSALTSQEAVASTPN
jgi:hypothetical protein